MGLRLKFKKLLSKRKSTNYKVYILILKGFEENLLQNISKLREKKKENRTDFLLVKNKEKSLIQNPNRFFYSKQFFQINYILNNKVFLMNYRDYETIIGLIKEKKEILSQMKDMLKTSVKYFIHLKEKSKMVKHNLIQHEAVVKFK